MGREKLIGGLALVMLMLGAPAGSAAAAGVPQALQLAGSGARGVVFRHDAGGLRAASRLAPHADCSNGLPPVSYPCPDSGGPLAYQGGPVVRAHQTHVIYWQESGAPADQGFPDGFRSTIDSYLTNVALDSATFGNVYAAGLQYGDATPGGAYASNFAGSLTDTTAYPARDLIGCPVVLGPPMGRPCVTDAQLQSEIAHFLSANGLPSGLGHIYFVVFPPNVHSCAGSAGGAAACDTNAYCGYHGDFGPAGGQTLYANMPFDAVAGCSVPDHPHGAASGADDELSILSHEHVETVTDPLGSQANERSAWFDSVGNEIGDKCTFPFYDPSTDAGAGSAYGPLLGGTPGSTAYNQLIHGDGYLLQREYSNVAGGCVTHVDAPAPLLTVSPGATQLGQPVTASGAGTAPGSGALDGMSFDFGDGSAPVNGTVATHVYPAPGTYTVRVTAHNTSFATAAAAQTVSILAPPPPPPAQLSAAQLAALLGLPADGSLLRTSGTLVFRRASCPPLCTLALRLYTRGKVPRARARAAAAPALPIGAATLVLAPGQSQLATLALTSTGKKLLARTGRLRVTLAVIAHDQLGRVTPLSRAFTLSGKKARRRARTR